MFKPIALLLAAAATLPAIADPTKDQQINAAAAVLDLRDSMKDPESFVLRHLLVTNRGFGCIEYRGKNVYGAMLPGSAVVTPAPTEVVVSEHQASRFAEVWNSECAGQGGRDLTTFVQKQLRK